MVRQYFMDGSTEEAKDHRGQPHQEESERKTPESPGTIVELLQTWNNNPFDALKGN